MGEESPARYFPLRWESTGDQWWYASPIDWAAANGHYDLVAELLRIDGNHLIKLTSLRRIRRLETVWDDHRSFHGAAKCRAAVARRLYLRCRSSLIRSGYGGWLLYTAASAGDLGFARDLLRRNPLLVFGEGEYGLTDLLYAAARGRCPDLFRLLLDSAAGDDSAAGVYAWEITNRAVHAAARGGDLTVLKDLLAGCSDVLAFRDVHGSTVLHTAAARGQLQILKYLIETYDVITASTDNHGNTALHVAAFRGQLEATEAMMTASPQLIYLRNHAGETFLHRAVSGFNTLQFRPLDRHLALLRRLVSVNAVVNARDSDGRTALHAAVSGCGSVHPDLVRILMMSADLNAADSDGLTALDILRRRPRSASSDVLIRQLISAGASDHGGAAVIRRAVASRLKMQGSSSPGSSFRISDSEILLYAGGVEPNSSAGAASPELSPCSRDEDRRRSSFASAAAKPTSSVGIFKQVLNWPRALSNKKLPNNNKSIDYDYGDDDGEAAEPPTPLRKRFSKPSLPGLQSSNKRTLAARSNQSSPNKKTKKKKLTTVVPPGKRSSRSSSFSSSSENNVKQKGVAESDIIAGPSSSSSTSTNSNSKRTMKSQYYLCFGNAGVSEVKTPGTFKGTVSLLA